VAPIILCAPPSSSAPNLVPSSTVPELHDVIQGGEGSSEMENPNAVCGDSEVRDVRAVRGGAPSAETSMLPRPEVRLHTFTL
jgi:hypothetical protein